MRRNRDRQGYLASILDDMNGCANSFVGARFSANGRRSRRCRCSVECVAQRTQARRKLGRVTALSFVPDELCATRLACIEFMQCRLVVHTGEDKNDYVPKTHPRLGGELSRHRRSPGRRSSGQGQGGRVCPDLLALRRRLLLHPGHRYLHQARRLSARRHHLQRRRARCAGLERRSRPAESFSRSIRFPFAHGVDGRYPHRHRIRRGPHLRPGRLPVQQLRKRQPGRLVVTESDRPQQRSAFHGGRRLRRGRVPFHPVRRLHLR